MTEETKDTTPQETFLEEQKQLVNTQIAVNRVLDHLEKEKGLKLNANCTRAEGVTSIIARLQADPDVKLHLSDRGWLVAEHRGKSADVAVLVEECLTLTNLGDRSSVQASVAAGKTTIKAKSDFKSIKEKSDFIDKFGSRAYDALPMQRTTPADLNPLVMTGAQYSKMTVAQKCKFMERDDVNENVVLEILRRK